MQIFKNDAIVFKISNNQIVDGEIPDDLLKKIRVGVTELDLSGCSDLNTMPNLPPRIRLKGLDLSGCSGLNTMPNFAPFLRKLNLSGCSKLTTLPELPRDLKEFNISGCTRLVTLPANFPQDLEGLNINRCSSLIDMPDLPPRLHYLNLDGCNQLSPESIAKLEAFAEANQNNPNFRLVWTEHLANFRFSRLTTLPQLNASLRKLNLEGCSDLKTLPELPPNLQILNLSGCSDLITLPELPPNLKELNLSGCSRLNSLPNLPPSLRKLNLDGCSSLTTLPNLPQDLEEFNLHGCSRLNSLPNLPPSLRKLNLDGCSSLTTLPNLPQNLEEFNLHGCYRLNNLPNLPRELKDLDLHRCSNLTTLPNLPPNLQRLDLSRCSSLTTLPDLPPSLRKLDLSGCNQLSLESIRKLEAFEIANQHNPNFQLIWPEHLTNNFQIINSLKDAYRKYHDSNPDFAGREPNISDQVNYPTLYLFHRFTSERLENRGKKEVVISASLVAQEIKNNPQLLEIIDNKSKNYLTACVNQPVCGFAEIATLVEIAKQDNITAKIQKAKILRVLQLIKNNIRTLKNPNGNIVGEGVQVELGNAILREVHKKLLAQNIISQPWPGIPGNIAYEATIQSFLTDDNIEKMSNLAKEALLPTLDCERETIDFLCGVETDFWAMMILKKEEREIDNQRIKELKEEILDLDTNETDRINQIQKQIEEIERNKSANLVEKLQQKTRVLLQANRVSLQNSISPASIEPDITTTNQQTDSAGGVFNQTLEPNPSLFSLLRELESRISQIELSVDVVALTEIAQQELQPRSNLRPQSAPPNTNSDSSIARPRAVPRARTNAGEASTSPRNSKNNCCVIN